GSRDPSKLAPWQARGESVARPGPIRLLDGWAATAGNPAGAEAAVVRGGNVDRRNLGRLNEAARTADAYACCASRLSPRAVCVHDAKGVVFGRCSIFGMLTVEPCSSLLPVECRFKFQQWPASALKRERL